MGRFEKAFLICAVGYLVIAIPLWHFWKAEIDDPGWEGCALANYDMLVDAKIVGGNVLSLECMTSLGRWRSMVLYDKEKKEVLSVGERYLVGFVGEGYIAGGEK